MFPGDTVIAAKHKLRVYALLAIIFLAAVVSWMILHLLQSMSPLCHTYNKHQDKHEKETPTVLYSNVCIRNLKFNKVGIQENCIGQLSTKILL